jgi:hypothetical protein
MKKHNKTNNDQCLGEGEGGYTNPHKKKKKYLSVA